MPDDVFSRTERRIQALETTQAVEAVHRKNVSDWLVAIEETLSWLVRLVIGGLVMGIIAFILQGGLMP